MPSKFDEPLGLQRTIMLDMSPRHLTQKTIDWLEFLSLRGDPLPFCGAEIPYGWMLYCQDDRPDDTPDDLWACMQYAKANDCDWVRFDCDQDPYEDLPLLSED